MAGKRVVQAIVSVGLALIGVGAFAQQGGPGAGQAQPMTRQVINAATYPDARCNDGTPFTYYFRPGFGADRNKWVIHLQGGTACTSDASCQERAKETPNLVTAAGMPPAMSPLGLLSADKGANPDFASFNQVLAHYCSSDFWAGDTEHKVGNAIWQFRGRPIVDALVADLKARSIGGAPTLAVATDVLVAGSSAGAMGTHNNIDRIAAALPNAKVKGLLDSGWIPAEMKPFGPGLFGTFNIYGPEALAYYNAKPDDSCVAANPSKAWACLNEEFAFAYLKTPVFVFADRRDPSMLSVLGGVVGPSASRAEMDYVLTFGREVAGGVTKTPAYFLVLRSMHTVLLTPEFSTVSIGTTKFTTVLGNWYFDRPGTRQLAVPTP
jgi:hypothetical protein